MWVEVQLEDQKIGQRARRASGSSGDEGERFFRPAREVGVKLVERKDRYKVGWGERMRGRPRGEARLARRKREREGLIVAARRKVAEKAER
jgi:hypothetical protein